MMMIIRGHALESGAWIEVEAPTLTEALAAWTAAEKQADGVHLQMQALLEADEPAKMVRADEVFGPLMARKGVPVPKMKPRHLSVVPD